jgi:hypothetical protein
MSDVASLHLLAEEAFMPQPHLRAHKIRMLLFQRRVPDATFGTNTPPTRYCPASIWAPAIRRNDHHHR